MDGYEYLKRITRPPDHFNEWGENSATGSAHEWSSASGHGQYPGALAGL
jgi:hypothetical protein